ncbi:uncharacterized protein EDB93DRAFT_1133148 [Suillus bovinus]|uniref:uncharacterized protein n=1 Tax=Suillus bovinus TaxID=48563 RepID=UPI001B87A39E|nr:uncharacterized protein EDB93DRAFT_1133148 [Suillus bovinus]KAG2154185.1 hypothetical protein EDB93DRAFT_1133148 [Suillus bovinus]
MKQTCWIESRLSDLSSFHSVSSQISAGSSIPSISMAIDPLQFISLIAFLSALEARGVSLATGLTNTIIYFPFNGLSNGFSFGPSKTRMSASHMGFFDHTGEDFVQDPSTRDSGYPLGFSDTTSSTASFPLFYQFLLIFSGQLASISRDILSLRRSVASLESSLSAAEDQIALLTNAHESILAQFKDEVSQNPTKASFCCEELGRQLHYPSSTMNIQQGRVSTLRQACTIHISPDHQPLVEHAQSYKEFETPQKCLRAQFTTQIQEHIECKKHYAALRQDLQKLSDLVSINDTKTNISLDHLRSQIVDQLKDQNRTEKEVALLREQMTRKFGAFQSRVSSLTLDTVKVHHGVQLSDQAAKEARREKAMAALGRRITQLQDTVPQNNGNDAMVPISVGRFQDSDVFKASSPCVQWVGTTAPSDIKVLRSPPPSRKYISCKESVNGIHSPSTTVAFRQVDAKVGVLRTQKGPINTASSQHKDVNWMPTPSPSSPAHVVVSTIPVLPRPGLSAIRRDHVPASRIFKPSDSEYRNKSLYASPQNGGGARIRGWI